MGKQRLPRSAAATPARQRRELEARPVLLMRLVERADEDNVRFIVVAEQCSVWFVRRVSCPVRSVGASRSQLAGLLREHVSIARFLKDGSFIEHDRGAPPDPTRPDGHRSPAAGEPRRRFYGEACDYRGTRRHSDVTSAVRASNRGSSRSDALGCVGLLSSRSTTFSPAASMASSRSSRAPWMSEWMKAKQEAKAAVAGN